MKRKFSTTQQRELFAQGLYGCQTCGEIKPVEDFGKDARKARYITAACKLCGNKAWSKRAKANPEKRREALRKWRERNPEKVREYDRKWLNANPEKRREVLRKWCEKNPEKVRAYNHKRWEKNPEKAIERAFKWKKANPEKYREIQRRRVDKVADGYVIGNLVRKTKLSPEELRQIPELIMLKRIEILSKRKIKSHGKSAKTTEQQGSVQHAE